MITYQIKFNYCKNQYADQSGKHSEYERHQLSMYR